MLDFLFKKRSIKWQFTFIIVLIVLPSLIVLGITTYNTTKAEIYDNIETITEKQVEAVTLYANNVYASGNDKKIAEFKEEISSLVIGKTGFIFLLDNTGTFVLHPKAQGENWIDQGFVQTILEKEKGFHRYISPKTNTYKIVSFAPVENTDLILVASAFEDEFLDGLYYIQNTTFLITGGATILAILISFVVAYWFGNSFHTLSKKMKTIADGDLTQSINDNLGNKELNEMGSSFSSMVGKLKLILRSIHQNAVNTTTMANELMHSATEVNATTETLSTSIQELADGGQNLSQIANNTKIASEELSSVMKKVSSISQQTKDDASATASAAKQGSAAAEKAGEKMNQIHQNVQSSSDIVEDLGVKTKEISKVIEMINDIAEQTNLLALNAAIEAARAGESGRGFAVVADEVRNLADESRGATTKIEKMITEIVDQTRSAVESMSTSKQDVEESSKVVNDSLSSLHMISDKIVRVASQVKKINEFSVEQVRNATQVDESVGDVSSFAEESAASTEQASASIQQTTASTQLVAETAKRLSAGAKELEQAVSQFKLD